MEHEQLVAGASMLSGALRERVQPPDRWDVTTQQLGGLDGDERFELICVTLTRPVGTLVFRYRDVINAWMLFDTELGADGVVDVVLDHWQRALHENDLD
jgi:hypothetical protein